jgi:hypothetical protein
MTAHRFSPSADWRIDDADAGNMTVHIGSAAPVLPTRKLSVAPREHRWPRRMAAMLRIAVMQNVPVAALDDRLVAISVSWPAPGQ